MEDLSKFVIADEGLLKKLNISIDKVIEEKESFNLNYNLLEKILGLMVRNSRYINIGNIRTIVPVKKSEILTVTLDFFKSIDIDFYKKAVDTILHKDKNINMNIYNFHDVKNFNEKNNNNFVEYTDDGSVQYENGLAQVNIPTKTSLYPKEEKVFDKDTCVLEDLYTVVHEISHLFDLNLEAQRSIENGTMTKNYTRQFTAEATTIAFEGLLTEYLLKNDRFSKEGIQEIARKRANDTIKDARLVYAKLLLSREKTKNGEITSNFIEKLMRDNNLSNQTVRGMAYEIINIPRSMLFQNKYAIGGLIAPTIIKSYKENGSVALKEYLGYVKNGDLENALKAIGIEPNLQGIYTLNKNYGEQLQTLNEKER